MPIPSRAKLLSSKTYQKGVSKADDPLGYDIRGKAIYQEGAFSVYPKRRNDLMMNMEPKEAKYFHYMVTRHGMSENHALGMLSNIKREVQSLDPKKPSGDDKGPGGLFQWKGNRQTPKVARMVKDGDWKAQIDYALTEPSHLASGGKNKDGSTKYIIRPGDYLKAEFKSAEDAEEWWRVRWERASAPGAEAEGKKHLKRYKKGYDPSPGKGEVFRLDKPLGDY